MTLVDWATFLGYDVREEDGNFGLFRPGQRELAFTGMTGNGWSYLWIARHLRGEHPGWAVKGDDIPHTAPAVRALVERRCP